MPFPEKKRIIFKKNPIDSVVCQLRFPPILKIDSEIPAKFQDIIRERFPNYSETTNLNINVETNLQSPIPHSLLQKINHQNNFKNYEFKSDDGIWKVNLTRTFIALTTNKYEKWEKFTEVLNIPLQALIKTYSPSYFTRIGLRYIDVIKRSDLGLSEYKWRDLLNPSLIGLLADNHIGDSVTNLESTNEIKLLDNESHLRLNTKFVKENDNPEIFYMIDSDFYNENKISDENVFEKLNFLNSNSTKLIQWCINSKLLTALEPSSL